MITTIRGWTVKSVAVVLMAYMFLFAYNLGHYDGANETKMVNELVHQICDRGHK